MTQSNHMFTWKMSFGSKTIKCCGFFHGFPFSENPQMPRHPLGCQARDAARHQHHRPPAAALQRIRDAVHAVGLGREVELILKLPEVRWENHRKTIGKP